jgi:hypothetical protein
MATGPRRGVTEKFSPEPRRGGRNKAPGGAPPRTIADWLPRAPGAGLHPGRAAESPRRAEPEVAEEEHRHNVVAEGSARVHRTVAERAAAALKVSSRNATPTPAVPPTARKVAGVQGRPFTISANSARRTEITLPSCARPSTARLDRHFRQMRSSSRGTAPFTWRGGRGSCVLTCSRMASTLSAWKGRWPASNSYRTTPRL